METETPLVDFSFVHELSGDDTSYIYDVISLFLATVPEKLLEFEKQVRETEDYDLIAKQAHFLKSSSSIIKIRDMHADLAQIEVMSGNKMDIAEIREKLDQVLKNYKEALPILIAEQMKHKPADK